MVYAINAFLILLWNGVVPNDNKKKKKLLCILYCLQWILISGLRAYSVGADTYAYKLSFEATSTYSWKYVFNRFALYLNGTEGIKDPGYMVIEKAFSTVFGSDYTLFLMFIACVFTIPMTVWIYKYSDNVCLSFMIYSALFYSFFAITGHRQTIASAIVIFGGYECMKKNKIVPLLLLHFIAFFIHKSSICFIVLYFARFIKINKWYWVVAVTGILLSFVFKSQLRSVLVKLMGYENYPEQFEGAGTYTFTACLTLIVFAAILFYRQMRIDEDCKYAMVATTIALFFVPLTFLNPSAMRVVQYFSVFIMLLVPRIINSLDFKNKSALKIFCYSVLLAYIVFKTGGYSFVFWS